MSRPAEVPVARAARFGVSRPVASTSRSVPARVRRFGGFLLRSLWVRVIVATMALSALVMGVLGVALQSQITERLLQNKVDAAVAEVDAARQSAADNLVGAEVDPSRVQGRLNLALEQLADPAGGDGSSSQGSNAGVFEPVLIRRPLLADEVGAGPSSDVPESLRERIQAGQLASQYVTVIRDGLQVPALIVGAPVSTRNESYELYLIYLLSGEQQTLDLVRNTLLVGGALLLLLLALIAALVAYQVVRPVRQASAAASRLAGGALDERMAVRGPVELAQLSRSFNGMAQAIKAQIRRLEEFGQLQRQFTSDVSHELRTPLTTVRMAADLLHADREELPPHLARSTELMVDELDRFEVLLADLLEISRYDAGMAELNAEVIDIRSAIGNAIYTVTNIAAQAGVQIITMLPDEPVRAEIDSRRIERILRNLLANAIDHAEGRPVEVELAADDTAVAVVVSDSGVGLKPGEAGLVFNRFWRADPSRQRQTGGTGLGLAISLEDARLHGGWLQAFGRPGDGARFRLTLPRRQGTLLLGSPLPLDPDESAGPVGPASVSQFTHSVPEEMQLPVSAVPVASGNDGLLSAAALSALSSGFNSGAAADPDEHRPEPT
ncbi:MtrAB system histidine kinase MtrB [Nakamurella deserti]|uniref:MtrAB system histidine kinase MtrB n=1 Tax=Nakamurella deserti TaxID=2164074 RepID=UPI000DBE9306|nr:MtrAB system histidine kinase MtrB [Nakamurella deserti]